MAGRDRSASRSVDPEGASNPPKSDGPEKITRVRRGRPPLEKPKVSTTIRLSRDVIDHFKSGGKGWQTRIDQALREWIGKRDAA
ncbi:MAG: BrnA antitoxin family protein [Gammaproteobacteria bacterium]|nr:BrnA antitoxin family protein [Gammaproteobacteria bacterium]MDE0611653.1 BrnA antitoxin family protein [Gammaproteobacteria bacterium]